MNIPTCENNHKFRIIILTTLSKTKSIIICGNKNVWDKKPKYEKKVISTSASIGFYQKPVDLHLVL